MARRKRLKRTKDGSVDLRTKEGKVIAERMAKARRAKNNPFRKFLRALKVIVPLLIVVAVIIILLRHFCVL